jgi:hypothetical protein
MVEDGVNSALRYYLNNFADGTRQDMYDLFLGKYVITEDSHSPFRNEPNILLFLFITILLMIIAVMVSPFSEEKKKFLFLFHFRFHFNLFFVLELEFVYKIGVIFFFLIALVTGGMTIIQHGRELVNNPSLVVHQ